MKSIYFSLAFMLISSFAIANDSQSNEVKYQFKTEKIVTENVMNFHEFLSKFDKSSITRESITFNKDTGTFTHIDSCGNTWTVTYWGYSFFEVVQILWELDSFLCWLA